MNPVTNFLQELFEAISARFATDPLTAPGPGPAVDVPMRPGATAIAVVSFREGFVWLKSSKRGDSVIRRLRGELESGDIVGTEDGRAELELRGGTRVRLEKGTAVQVEIDSDSRTIRLVKGCAAVRIGEERILISIFGGSAARSFTVRGKASSWFAVDASNLSVTALEDCKEITIGNSGEMCPQPRNLSKLTTLRRKLDRWHGPTPADASVSGIWADSRWR